MNRIDLSAIPPVMPLTEPEDVATFKIVVREVEQARVPVNVLENLAGDRAADPEWCRGLGKRSTTRSNTAAWAEGGMRAHIERPS